jgi:protein-tyrosine-phosphatase
LRRSYSKSRAPINAALGDVVTDAFEMKRDCGPGGHVDKNRRAIAVVMILGLCLAGSRSSALTQTTSASRKAPTVLFMCPHGAAKSVLASAYFERAAQERGLKVVVTSAGTAPDPAVAPAVAAHLTKNGYSVPISKPARATAEQVATADVVVSLGCDLTGYPAPQGRILNWDDVPSPSQDFEKADAAIKQKVAALIDELVRQRAKAR